MRLLGRLLQSLQCQPIIAQINPLLLFELVGQPVDDTLVEILAAEKGIAVGRLYFEDALGDIEDRNVKGTAAKIIDRDFAGALLFEPIGKSGGGRLVDDAQHFEPGDPPGVLGGLALRSH